MEEEQQDHGKEEREMKRASQFFSEDERKMINQSVEEAESNTSGEIVPVVATASGRYDRAEDLFGLLFAMTLLVICWVFFQKIRPIEGDWTSGQTLTLGLIPILFIVGGGFVLGAVLATYFPFLRLPFITAQEMREEVERRAAEAFHHFRVRKTTASTGILIYVSLYERMVRVLGDDAINEKLEQKDWDEVCRLIVEGIRSKRAADGLRHAILKCGELLSSHFPIQPDDVNELSNELRIID